jgi:predicted amidohydrolase YtcJ
MSKIDLALVGARVRTLDSERPGAAAVAIAEGEIVAVGSDAEIRELGAAAETIDLHGAGVVPGLTDSHIHALQGALETRGADLRDLTSLDDVRAAVSAERQRCAPGQWVLGFGLEYGVFRDSGIRGDLFEDVSEGLPALLHFMDMHTAVATPHALELAGVAGPQTFAENAEIVCREGEPTGELREWAAVATVERALPQLTGDDRYALHAAALREHAAAGLTGGHVMDGTLATHDLLRELEGNGDLVQRFVVPFTIEPESEQAEWTELLPYRDVRGRRWRAGVAKFFIDGVIDTGTGWLYEPDSEGDGTLPFWPDPQHYRRAVATFAGAGFQCSTHATGDRGVREALDAYRDAASPPLRGRHRIEHIETLQPQDLRRFAAEGIVASMQAQHMLWCEPDRSDNWSRRLGPERSAPGRAFPICSLRESGATVALGSDWPVVRFDPRLGLSAARLRRPPGERSRAPYDDQAIDALAALAGYTTCAAATIGEEARLGRIRAGFAADITVFADDPVECDPDELPELPVVLTVVDGEIVHRAD